MHLRKFGSQISHFTISKSLKLVLKGTREWEVGSGKSGKWEKRGRSTLASHFAARTIRDEKCRMSEIGKGEC